jgi:hypothetical protein
LKRIYPSLFDPSKNIEVWFCDAPCCNGKELHCDNGPAVVYPDGSKEWWLHGKQVTEAEVLALNGELVAKAFREPRSSPVESPEPASFNSSKPRKATEGKSKTELEASVAQGEALAEAMRKGLSEPTSVRRRPLDVSQASRSVPSEGSFEPKKDKK